VRNTDGLADEERVLHSTCTVWVKKIPPELYWHFPQTVGNF